MNQTNVINPDTILPMDVFVDDFPITIELAYARDDNLLFGERIYHQDARLWLHEDLAKIVLLASLLVRRDHEYVLELYDGLRTTDAQARMLKTQRVKDNPHWLEEPRLLSPPGAGAHPRGMAIDISISGMDMGTAFDDLSKGAHRGFAHNEDVMKNRDILTGAMIRAARDLDLALLPLPQEWWDFRLPQDIYEQFAPLSDADLPDYMVMMRAPSDIPQCVIDRAANIQEEIQSAFSSM